MYDIRASVDVVFLYASIPIKEPINKIQNNNENDNVTIQTHVI